MTPQYFVQGIFATAGLIALLASILNWNWFFTAQNAQLIVRNVGRGRARLFYGLLGVIMIGMAVFFFLHQHYRTDEMRRSNFLCHKLDVFE